MAMFSLCHQMEEAGREPSRASFIKTLIISVTATPSQPNHLPKLLHPNTFSHWKLGFNILIWQEGDTNIKSIVFHPQTPNSMSF